MVEYKRYKGREFRREWATADVLLLGCDSNEVARVGEAMREMEHGLLGTLREWDVLWYFVDGRVPRDARIRMGGSGLCRNDAFSEEGIRMVRAHVRRRFDITAQRGLFITLEQWITDGIDRLVTPNPRRDNFGQKVNRLKSKMDEVTGDRDWDLFIATVEFLMEARNRSSHPRVSSSFDSRQDAYDEFKKVARRYGFEIPPADHGCPIETDSQNRQVFMKLLVALSRMAKVWLDECNKSIWK